MCVYIYIYIYIHTHITEQTDESGACAPDIVVFLLIVTCTTFYIFTMFRLAHNVLILNKSSLI